MNCKPRAARSANPGGIYIHIPFCLRKCPYCDFFSVAVTDRSLLGPFLDAVFEEMRLTPAEGIPFDTLYIGGGTPSLLEPEQVARLIAGARSSYGLNRGSEVTLEVNPGSADLDRLRGYRTAGVNRLNIGVQSLREENLRFLGRIHSADDALQAFDWARRAGYDNLGADLIYGLPDQSEEEWVFDLREILARRPEHLSCYMLTYERGTTLHRFREQGRILPMGDGRVGDLFQATIAYLKKRRYLHYEISNFARTPETVSRHNRKYWNFTPYIGLGPSAHSFWHPSRRWNIADVNAYIDTLGKGRLPVAGEETLGRSQEMIEAVYLGLRQTDGLSFEGFEKRFGKDFRQVAGDTAASLADDGLLRFTPSGCALTTRGMLFLDAVTARLVGDLE